MKDYHRNYPDIIAFGLSKGKNIENANLFVPEKKIGCSSEEAIEQMFRSKAVDFYVWNKFFKRELFNHIVFPENKLYEDMVPMYEAFRAASKIDILPFSGIFIIKIMIASFISLLIQNSMIIFCKEKY